MARSKVGGVFHGTCPLKGSAARDSERRGAASTGGQSGRGEAGDRGLAGAEVSRELGGLAGWELVFGEELPRDDARGACGEGLGTVIEHGFALLWCSDP